MDIRVLDLDGSLPEQEGLLARFRPAVHDLRWWGPRLRLGCSFGGFRRWETALAKAAGSQADNQPQLTFVGSGDFHHISLALVRRLRRPFNLLVLDNHPDWMRGLPFLHCGTWLYHAARLPQLEHIFHLGGNVDFDNRFRWLAPWKLLRTGKIHVLPGIRHFGGPSWKRVSHEPLRPAAETPLDAGRLSVLLDPYRAELARFPLYVSLDKDVMLASEAAVNWDSGHLTLPEVETVLGQFTAAAGGRLAGMDVVGDWSPVQARGLLRRFLDWTEHPTLDISAADAAAVNQRANVRVADLWEHWQTGARPLAA
jgi:hypothetical protein